MAAGARLLAAACMCTPSGATTEHSRRGTIPFKADVTEGADGAAYMAIELNAPTAVVGVSFASIFAKMASLAQLDRGWSLLDPATHVFTKREYSANPVLRYFAADRSFYLIALFANVPNRSRTDGHGLGGAKGPKKRLGSSSCCFVE